MESDSMVATLEGTGMVGRDRGVSPDGERSAHVNEYSGPESAFAELDSGRYSVMLSRLHSHLSHEDDGPPDAEIDLRWLGSDEQDQLLPRLHAPSQMLGRR